MNSNYVISIFTIQYFLIQWYNTKFFFQNNRQVYLILKLSQTTVDKE